MEEMPYFFLFFNSILINAIYERGSGSFVKNLIKKKISKIIRVTIETASCVR
jgi:hypothetical protein